jgi:hypothetical protein
MQERGPMPPTSDIPYRLQLVETETSKHTDRLGKVEDLAKVHEFELHGERGVNATLRDLANEIKWLRRALWGLAASVTIASIVFAAGTVPH